MTYQEYEAKIKEIVANPDTLANASVDLLSEIKKDTDTLAAIHATNEANAKKVRELQDANYQLFLRVTGQPADGTAPQQDDARPLDTLMSKMFETKEEENNGD